MGGELGGRSTGVTVEQILFSLAEAAGILGIAEPTLRELVNEGAIQFVQLRYGRGDYRFSRADLEAFVTGLPRQRKGDCHQPVTNRDTPKQQVRSSSKRTPIVPIRSAPYQEAKS